MIKKIKKLKNNIKGHLKRTRNFFFFSFSKKIKFVVGAGGIITDKSWYYTDMDTLDLTKDRDWKKLLSNFRIDNIMAEHVWEHLTDEDTMLANNNCYKYLKQNGIMRLAVPDGFNPDKDYIDYVKPGGNGAGADDHKILYNYKIMKERLERAGFTVKLLEYWDERGKFNYVDWGDENGHIRRSRRYDQRNKNGDLKYTSLIIDAIKK